MGAMTAADGRSASGPGLSSESPNVLGRGAPRHRGTIERIVRVRSLSPILALLLMLAGCRSGAVPDLKKPGVFIEVDGFLVEIRQLGTLGNTYGPRLYPELPEYNIPTVDMVTPIYLNLPELATAPLKGIEWHGYRLGGNASPDRPSTATPADWKAVEIKKEETSVPGVFKVVVVGADAQGRWKPEPAHEYFGIAVDAGYKAGPIWAVKIK
jgi:hypothetical protein